MQCRHPHSDGQAASGRYSGEAQGAYSLGLITKMDVCEAKKKPDRGGQRRQVLVSGSGA